MWQSHTSDVPPPPSAHADDDNNNNNNNNNNKMMGMLQAPAAAVSLWLIRRSADADKPARRV